MRPKTTDVMLTRWRAKPRHADKIESIPNIEGAPVRTITFGNANQRTNFLRTYQKQIKQENKLKPALGLWLLLLTLVVPFAKANDLPNTPTPNSEPATVLTPASVRLHYVAPIQSNDRVGGNLFFLSTAACGSLLAASPNRTRAIEIGVPIWLGANLLAHKLYAEHPKVSHLLQIASPAGCYNASGGRSAQKLVVTKDPPTVVTPPVTTPVTVVNPPAGGNGSTGPGNSGGTGVTPPVVNPPVVNPPAGSGGGTGSGGGVNPPPPPTHGGCTVHGQTDCGFGNNGSNNGKNGKPPVTPPGNPHSSQPGNGAN